MISCNRNLDSRTMDLKLSKTDSVSIVEKVLAATDAFANANNKLDAKGVTEFWHSRPEFVLIENDIKYPSWDSIYSNCVRFYSSKIDSTNLVWLERNILPLSKTSASLFGRYEIYIKYSSGTIIHAVPFYSALLTKVDDKWKVLRGHESYKLLDK